jgi:hypothetical protein
MSKDNNVSLMTNLVRRRGGGLAVRVAKPSHLSPDGKRKYVVRGLGTQDIYEAQPLKQKVLAELWAEWSGQEPPIWSPRKEALEWSKDSSVGGATKSILLEDRTEQIEKEHGNNVAQSFYNAATGIHECWG